MNDIVSSIYTYEVIKLKISVTWKFALSIAGVVTSQSFSFHKAGFLGNLTKRHV